MLTEPKSPLGYRRKELADLLKYCLPYFDRLVSKGKLPKPVRVLGRPYWPVEDVVIHLVGAEGRTKIYRGQRATAAQNKRESVTWTAAKTSHAAGPSTRV